MTATALRELPPLGLDVDITDPSGRHARWGADEPSPANVPGSLSFSSTIPGGFEQCSCVLARQPEIDWSDLEEFSTITVRGIGAQTAWQGRLEKTPRASGDQLSISPAAVGWQAHLDDDATAREIYVDRDLTRWAGPSLQRQLNRIASSFGPSAAGAIPDPVSGKPSLGAVFTGPANNPGFPDVEALYSSAGIPIGSLYIEFVRGQNVSGADGKYAWFLQLSTDDVASSVDQFNFANAASGSDTLLATTSTRKYILVVFQYGNTGLLSGTQYAIYWQNVAVYGNHGLTGKGPNPVGFLASDIIANALARWAPKLATTFAGASTIRPTTFVIPQLAYFDPTTASQIVKDATRFELPDWAVWEGPTFWCYPRPDPTATSLDTTLPPKRWRARVYPAKLSETGPQVDRLFNGVIVQYADVTGITRTVGPPGSTANVTDSSLIDSDPLNPVNEAGIRRWTLLQMGVSTSAGAIKVGGLFLAQQKLLNSSGQAALLGHVEDDHGVMWPAYMVRAGDQISFVDASDPSYRRIVSASYDDPTKTNTLSLDAPPQGLQALLERLQVVIAPLGF